MNNINIQKRNLLNFVHKRSSHEKSRLVATAVVMFCYHNHSPTQSLKRDTKHSNHRSIKSIPTMLQIVNIPQKVYTVRDILFL